MIRAKSEQHFKTAQATWTSSTQKVPSTSDPLKVDLEILLWLIVSAFSKLHSGTELKKKQITSLCELLWNQILWVLTIIWTLPPQILQQVAFVTEATVK